MPTPRKCVQNHVGEMPPSRRAKASRPPAIAGKILTAPPPEIKGDKTAEAAWNRIKATYQDVGYDICAGDVEAVTRLCLLYSEAEGIRKAIMGAGADSALDLQAHRLLDSKRGKIQQLETVLLLTPAARMRAFPQKKPEVKKELPDNLKGLEGRL